MRLGVWAMKAVIEGPEGSPPPLPRISEVLIMLKPFVSLKCMLNLTECATPFWLRPYVTCSHFLLKEYLSDSWL